MQKTNQTNLTYCTQEGTKNCPCPLADPCRQKRKANQQKQAPTLKQLFSKTNLTTYIEAARHKPLNNFNGGE